MRDFETAYNTMAQQMETLSANITLWNDHNIAATASRETNTLLFVASKSTDVPNDVIAITGFGPGQYEKNALKDRKDVADLYNPTLALYMREGGPPF